MMSGGGIGICRKEPDAVAASHGPQLGGERDQVIIVHPDHVVGFEQRLQPAGKHLVHPPVAGSKAGVEIREVEPVMKHGPQDAVGVAQVVRFVILAAQVDRGERDIAWSCELKSLCSGRRLRRFANLSAPAEPEAAGTAAGSP